MSQRDPFWLFLIGLAVTIITLAVWRAPNSFLYGYASHLTVAGFRLHHWMMGIVCVAVGAWKRSTTLGWLLIGVGVALVMDDAADLIMTA